MKVAIKPPASGSVWMNDDDSLFVKVLEVTETGNDDGFFLVIAEIEGDPLSSEFTPDEWQEFITANSLTTD